MRIFTRRRFSFFHLYNDWPWLSSIYYAIDTGLSIGYGALQPKDDLEKLVVAANVLIGAGAVSGALALFTDSLLASSSNVLSEELANSLGEDVTKLSVLEQLTVEEQQARLSKEKAESRSNSLPQFADNYLKNNASWEEELLLFYLLIGTAYGIFAEGYTPISGLYFAITSLSTSGLQTPTINTGSSSDVSEWHALFVSVYCFTGVPIFAANLGKVAAKVVEQLVRIRERETLQRPLTLEEFKLAASLIEKQIKNEEQADENSSLFRTEDSSIDGAGDADSSIDRTELAFEWCWWTYFKKSARRAPPSP